MRGCYTSKVLPKPPCLIANTKLEKFVQLEVKQTDFSNFIFAIKQGGLEKTLEV